MSVGAGYACVPCQTYLHPRQNSIIVLETMEDHRPYKIWQADLWECPDCQHQVILGYGVHPVSEHYMDGFDDWLARVDQTILGCPKGLKNKPMPWCTKCGAMNEIECNCKEPDNVPWTRGPEPMLDQP